MTSEEQARELTKRFVYHAPHGTQPEKYSTIRSNAYDLAYILMELCPESRELSLAITKLEEVVFWANAAIARNSEE